jgi:hypothetical protein
MPDADPSVVASGLAYALQAEVVLCPEAADALTQRSVVEARPLDPEEQTIANNSEWIHPL